MLHYEITGAGETIVFLHGALVGLRMWDHQVRYFKERYRVLAIDLPEHGQSLESNLPEFSVQTISAAVVELLEKLGIHCFHLIGHSLGGMVAQELVLTYPERVGCLILAETSYGTRTNIWENISSASAKLLLQLMTKKQLVSMSKNTYGKLHDDVRHFIAKEIGAYDIRQSRRVMSAALSYESKGRLGAIKNRTLILVGECNKQTHLQGQALHELIERSEFAVIPGAHHLLNMDNPSAFNSEIERFLESGC